MRLGKHDYIVGRTGTPEFLCPPTVTTEGGKQDPTHLVRVEAEFRPLLAGLKILSRAGSLDVKRNGDSWRVAPLVVLSQQREAGLINRPGLNAPHPGTFARAPSVTVVGALTVRLNHHKAQ